MKNKKSLLSVLLAAVLLCACVAGMLIFGAQAEGEYTATYAVEDGGSVTAAMEQIAAAVEGGTITAGPVLIDVKASVSETATDGYLFWGETIKVGNEPLDITIQGAGADTVVTVNGADANGHLNSVNDFTFKNFTLTTAEATQLNLGNRNVTFDSVVISDTVLLNDHNVTENSSLTILSGTYSNYFYIINGTNEVAKEAETKMSVVSGNLKSAFFYGSSGSSIIKGKMSLEFLGGTIGKTYFVNGASVVEEGAVATLSLSDATMSGHFMGVYDGSLAPTINGALNVNVTNATLSGTFRTAMLKMITGKNSVITTNLNNVKDNSTSGNSVFYINGVMDLHGKIVYNIDGITVRNSLYLFSCNNKSYDDSIKEGEIDINFNGANKVTQFIKFFNFSKTDGVLVVNANVDISLNSGSFTGALTAMTKSKIVGDLNFSVGSEGETTTIGNIYTVTEDCTVSGDYAMKLAGGTVRIGIKDKETLNVTDVTAATTITRGDVINNNEHNAIVFPAEDKDLITVVNPDILPRGYMWIDEEELASEGKCIVEESITPSGMKASLVLTDRVGIRVMFHKDIFEHARTHSGKKFAYYCGSFGIPSTDPVVLEWDQIAKEGDYYYIDIISGIGPKLFSESYNVFTSVFSYKAVCINTLATAGATEYAESNPEAAAMFNALLDYGKATVEGTTALDHFDADAVASLAIPAAARPVKGEGAINFTNVTLLMGDTLGIRFKADGATTGATVKFNGAALAADQFAIGENCVDLYVSAETLLNPIPVEIYDAEGVLCASFGYSVAGIANSIYTADNTNLKAASILNLIAAIENYVA